MSRVRWMSAATVVVLGATLLAGVPNAHAVWAPSCSPADLDARLDRAWRIDLTDLRVEYDFRPDEARIDGRAVLDFRLRPGVKRAVFHFNPERNLGSPDERKLLSSLRLDGESLDPQDDRDVRLIRLDRPAEPAFEVQRDLTGDAEHTLEIAWSMPYQSRERYPGWFFPLFDDTVGPRDETETAWPTVSSPEELVRHRIDLRVHSAEPYEVIGSGTVERLVDGADDDLAQRWEIDTERPVSSSTVLFAAVPADQVRTARLPVRGVDVTIVSDQSERVVDRAVHLTERTINEMVDEFGPFPAPTMHVLLTGWGSGMEYYGATRTGLGSLRHELGHMYFGTATVNRTWRDTWFDEAAVQWWQRRNRNPLPPDFRSNIAADRPVVAPGFDLRAYGAGAKVLGEIARALGGTDEMIDFLADLHQRRAFEPFTTDDLIDDVVAAQDELDRGRLRRWLCS